MIEMSLMRNKNRNHADSEERLVTINNNDVGDIIIEPLHL